MGNEPYEFTLFYEHHTEKAIAVRELKDSEEIIWIPRSKIEEEYDDGDLLGYVKGMTIDITIPEWLAEEKGLL